MTPAPAALALTDRATEEAWARFPDELSGSVFSRVGFVEGAEWAAAPAAPAPAVVGEDLSDDEIFMLSKWEAHRGGAWKPEDPNSDLICRLIDGHFVRRLWDGDAPRDGFGKPFPADSFIGWTDAGRRLMQTLSAPHHSRDDAGQAVWRENLQAHIAAMRMIREWVEQRWVGALPSEEQTLPEPAFEAEAIIAALEKHVGAKLPNACAHRWGAVACSGDLICMFCGTHPPAPSAEAVKHAFRFADSNDWDFLVGQLPDGGRGRFWKAVFAEVRAALSGGAS